MDEFQIENTQPDNPPFTYQSSAAVIKNTPLDLFKIEKVSNK